MYRVGGDFERVVANIKELNRLKKLHGSPYPELTWQFVVFGHNEHEIPLARELASEWDMRFVPKLSWNSDFSPIRDHEYVRRQLGMPASTREEFAQEQGTNYMQHVCLNLWRSPKVNWDGLILGCCWTQEGFGGNAFRDGYVAAINNEKIRYARRMLLGMEPPRDDIACTQCKLYRDLAEKGEFLTMRNIHRKPLWYRVASRVYHASGLRWVRYNAFRAARGLLL